MLEKPQRMPTPAAIVKRTDANRAHVPSLGLSFRKDRLAPSLWRPIADFFTAHLRDFQPEPANEHVKTTDSSGFPSLLYKDEAYNRELLLACQHLHEQWAGRPLRPAAAYGIRCYQRGSYLHEHIDQIGTHVVSSTICVGHALDSPWPLCIEDSEGKSHEIDMAAGDILFFEGAHFRHGRPFALDGAWFANLYLHYTPLDWQAAPA
ncbi:hypothetical protein OAN12_00850 [Halioglobus sp.]|nr:hypothetical protein [Halioglobus sp.]